jgi:fucose permease
VHPNRHSIPPLLAVFPTRSASAALLAPCLPDIAASLGTSYEGIGALVGAVCVGTGLAVLAVGLLGHRARPRFLLVGGAALQVLAVIAFASSRTLETSFVAALFYGAAGVADLAATALLAGIGGARRGRLLSLAHGLYALGAVVVPLVAGVILGAGGTWRVLFVGAAGISVLTLAWVVLSGAGRGAPDATGAPAAATGTGLWRVRAFRRGALAMALYIGAEIGAVIWLPTWFRDRFGASVPVAAASVALFWASMTAGRLVLAHRVDRSDARGFVSRLGIIAACAWVGVLLSGHVVVALVGVALFGLVMSVCAPALQGFTVRPFPGSETSVFGWLSTVANVTGAAMSWTIGATAQRIQGLPDGGNLSGTGLTWALAGAPILLVVMAMVVRRPDPVTPPGAARSLP